MEQSPNLELPYIMPSQAQKHVTHNEAIRMIDALVHLAVLDRHLATPPGEPDAGDRYIVAGGAEAAWEGRDGSVAAWQDGAWAFLQPRSGWRAWVLDEARMYVFDGGAWALVATEALAAATLGINATADETNRLAIASQSVLLSHEGGDHRLIVNKAAEGNTASIVFQNGFSGRAEIGLAGSDGLSLKVSDDGSSFAIALVVDATTGAVGLPRTPCGQVNLLVNGSFRVNQRGFAGGALAAGLYGHDRWKAGAGGCNYSVSSGVVAHASGTVMQIVEGPDLAGTTVTLSVEDLEGGSLGVDIDGETGVIEPGSGRRGVTLTVPLSSTGNVAVRLAPTAGAVSYSRPQLNIGAVALPYERRHPQTELALCERYFRKSYDPSEAPGTGGANGFEVLFCAGASAAGARRAVRFPPMRAVPAVTIYNTVSGASGSVRNTSAASDPAAATSNVSASAFFGGASAGQADNDQIRFHWTADAEL